MRTTFFVPGGHAAILFQAINELLDACPLPIQCPIKGATPAFIPTTRDRHADTVALTPASDPRRTVPFIGRNPVRPEPWTTGAFAPHRAAIHEGLEDQTLMPMPWLEDKRKRAALPVTTHAQLRAESALGAAERFGVWIPPFAPAAC